MPPVGFRKYVLEAMPGTPKELREKTGFASRTITYNVKRAMAAGECHISKWKRSDGKGGFQPVYASGPGENAVCKLKPWTDAEIGKRTWKKMKQDGRADIRLAHDSARYYAKKAERHGFIADPLQAAFFGRKAA